MTDAPWELILAGWAGLVAPYGGEFLLACTRRRDTTDRVLAAAPGAVITQDGGDGQNVKFHARDLDLVAPTLRLRRRRQVSEEQRAAAIERLKPFAFTPGPHVVQNEGGAQPG